MKKFIAIALLLAMCLGLFAACGTNGEETTPSTEPVNALESATEYLRAMYKDKAGKVVRSFDLINTMTLSGNTFKIEWTTDASEEYVKLVAGETAVTVEIVNVKPAEQVDFTMTATLTDAEGKTASTALKYYIEAVEPEVSGATPITAPQAGATYKLGMFQGNLGQTLYFAGTTANKDYYMTTTEDLSAATDVTIEAVEGGYRMFFTVDGTKTYLDVYQNGDYVNLRLTTEPTAVWTWNTEYNTMVADVNGEAYYCGTYNEYNTLSASKLSYAATSFPSNLYTMGATATQVETPAESTPYKLGMFQGNLGQTLYFAGTTANKDYYMTTTEDLSAATDVTLEAVEGGYHISFMADGAKTYLDVYQNGDYVNLRLTTEPTAVWTWNTEYKTLVADVNGEAYYCGTYNEYNTLSASKLSYAATSFPSNLFTLGGASAPVTPAPDTGDTEEPEATEPEATEPEATNPPASGTEVTLTEGMKVVIYAPAYGESLSSLPSSEGSYYQMGVDVTVTDGVVTGYSDTEVWTVSVNADGSYSFSIGGKNLGMQDEYSSMGLGHPNDDWTVTSIGNGLYLIQNVVRGNYIEWYSSKDNWSSYNPNDPASDDQFQMAFYVVG